MTEEPKFLGDDTKAGGRNFLPYFCGRMFLASRSAERDDGDSDR